jgi:hypothetical protein
LAISSTAPQTACFWQNSLQTERESLLATSYFAARVASAAQHLHLPNMLTTMRAHAMSARLPAPRPHRAPRHTHRSHVLRRDNLLRSNNNNNKRGATLAAAAKDPSQNIVEEDTSAQQQRLHSQQRAHQERLHRHISRESHGELASCHRNLALEMVRVTESAGGGLGGGGKGGVVEETSRRRTNSFFFFGTPSSSLYFKFSRLFGIFGTTSLHPGGGGREVAGQR